MSARPGPKADASERPRRVHRAGLVVKRGSARVAAVAARVEEQVRARGIEVLLDPESARQLGRPGEATPIEAMPGRVDVAICLGGDGTFLHVARAFAPAGTPILGVNLGRIGFLTEIEPGEFEAFFERFQRGDVAVDERMMLEVRLAGGGGGAGPGPGAPAPPYLALNDAVVTKAALARIAEFELHVDGVRVTTYRADGMIVATPTGSTAYALAAGGPIVMPGMEALVVAPICPHAFSQRPLLVPAGSEVRLVAHPHHEDVYLSLDGQVGMGLAPGAELVVRRAACRARVVRDPGRSFFELLRVKLGWGER